MNIFSYSGSMTICMAFCTTLSLGAAIVKGIVSFFPGLGISTLMAGGKLYVPAFSSAWVFSKYFRFIPSKVISPIPWVIFTGLLLINSYAETRFLILAILFILISLKLFE
uniref:Uncharacterized protein n=1 Tax=Morchella importuna TaxID=1174673 RepID=A0A650AFG6_9PEZI|nr:hypothetical protein [Morchella importuna]QGN66780.1 hypothetical protein [Morchella importuna]